MIANILDFHYNLICSLVNIDFYCFLQGQGRESIMASEREDFSISGPLHLNVVNWYARFLLMKMSGVLEMVYSEHQP